MLMRPNKSQTIIHGLYIAKVIWRCTCMQSHHLNRMATLQMHTVMATSRGWWGSLFTLSWLFFSLHQCKWQREVNSGSTSPYACNEGIVLHSIGESFRRSIEKNKQTKQKKNTFTEWCCPWKKRCWKHLPQNSCDTFAGDNRDLTQQDGNSATEWRKNILRDLYSSLCPPRRPVA